MSKKLPGLIIQSYLVLVRLFDLDVFQPIGQQIRIEVVENEEKNYEVKFDEEPKSPPSYASECSESSDAQSSRRVPVYCSKISWKLEKSFYNSNFLTNEEIGRLSEETRLSKPQLQTWFRYLIHILCTFYVAFFDNILCKTFSKE